MSASQDIKKILEQNGINDESNDGFGSLEYLKILPILLLKVEALEKEVKHLSEELIPKLDLTKRSGVRKFLGVSDSTIHAMTKDGRFKEGIHFHKDLKGSKPIIVFVENAIRGYKENSI